ncbi:MAG: helix-turn-helix transcriptional regulator [Candidatus Kapaibacterium sp.]
MINSNNENDIIERFRKLFRLSGLTKSEFANEIDISHQSLNKYLKQENNIQKISLRIFRAGYSIDWLYAGIGKSKWNPDENRNSSIVNEEFDYHIQKERIKAWIESNYENIIEYEIARDFKKGEIRQLFENEKFIPYLILKRIESSGCNISWSITGEGDCYANNIIGNRLKEIKK